MRPYPLTMILVFVVLIIVGTSNHVVAADGSDAVAPEHQVAVMYFHRTNRCPTCKRISQYIDEAVQAGFAPRLADGTVTLYMIDYENAANQRHTNAYQITRPTLVLADVRQGKVTAFKAMPKVWSLVYDKDKFFEYVQSGVADYLGPKP